MITVWRLLKKKHHHSAFNGEGARIFGGRWNFPGTSVVYASESIALAALEIFVHLGKAAMNIDYVTFQVDIPDKSMVEEINISNLSSNWRNEPPVDETKTIGTDWVNAGTSPVLKVPSAIIPLEHNFIINPQHHSFKNLVIYPFVPFFFDPRMWK